MKKTITLLMAASFSAASYVQSMKMVIDPNGQTVGCYVRTINSTYTVSTR